MVKIKKQHWTRQIFAIVSIVVLYYIIQYATSVLAIYPALNLSEEISSYGNWIQITDHHLWQMVIALLFIGILSKGNFKAWGLNSLNIKESLGILKLFMLYYGVYFVGIGFLTQLLFISTAPQLGHSFTIVNVLGNIGFKGLLSGLSEEILFRGLIHTFLLKHFTRVWYWRKIEMPVAGFVSTLIFTFAHINFNWSNFEITHLYLPQLVLAFVLGLYYSAVYHKTGSLVNPILAHNFSNLTLYISELALFIIK